MVVFLFDTHSMAHPRWPVKGVNKPTPKAHANDLRAVHRSQWYQGISAIELPYHAVGHGVKLVEGLPHRAP